MFIDSWLETLTIKRGKKGKGEKWMRGEWMDRREGGKEGRA